MRHIYAKSFFSSILLFSAVSATAQNSNKLNSPYSRFGIGEMRNGVNTMIKAMGSSSSAYTSGFNVNTDNPASYGSLQLTTYEAGGEGITNTLVSGTSRYRTGMATISYMTVGLPIGKYAGMAFGLRPFSRSFYMLNDTSIVDTFGNAIRSYQGDGSLNQGFIGFGGKYKGVSLGFNFGYIFGTTENSSYLEPFDVTSKVISSRFYKKTRTGGIYWNAGGMYEHTLTKALSLRVGGTVSISQELKQTRDKYWIGYKYQADTALKVLDQKGKVVLPMKYSAGIQLIGTKNWSATVDYSAANWGEYRSYGMTDSLATNTYRLSAGAEYTPETSANSKYLARLTYRLGAYYGTDPVMLRNTQLNYYAVTGGVSFPFRKNVARIHTSLEVGSRGTTASGLIRENFVRFGIGLTLNDKWFIKTKYE